MSDAPNEVRVTLHVTRDLRGRITQAVAIARHWERRSASWRRETVGGLADVLEQRVEGDRPLTDDLAAEQVLGLDVVGALEDGADAGVPIDLGDFGVVDIAGAAVDLYA